NGVQVLGAAGAGELTGLGELVGDRDDVGRLAVRVQREDRVEDDLVLRDVEVRASNDFDHIGDRVFAEEHSADGTLLGQEVVRGNAVAPVVGAPRVAALARV